MTKIQKQQKKKNKQIEQNMAKKLLGYSAVAGAALVVGAPTAEALPIVLTNPSTQLIDLDGNGSDDIQILLNSVSGNAAFAYGVGGAEIAKYGSSPGQAVRFTNSSSITGAAAPKYAPTPAILGLSGTGGTTYGSFIGQRGFLGVRFDSPINGVGNDLAFVDLEVASDVRSLTIYNFGMVGASAPVPEPATLSTLALGLGGLYAMRRRSAKQKADSNSKS